MARLFRGMDRKSWAARFVSATLLGTLVLGFVVVNGELSQRATAVKPTVALVNEDLQAEFNDKAYAFGSNFVDRVTKDSEYNWTVLSRPVAEKAYKDGSVDAAIYLPQSFSHDILTLQELAPTKATVEYRLRPQVDEQSDRLLKSKIVDIVYGFNQSVVKMYYASVADNIAEADGYLNATLGNQEALIAALTSDVEEPFSGTMPNFHDFVSSATGLKDVNAATVEAQNSLSETVTDTLARTGEAFSSKLYEIDDHAKRQREIAQINAANSNTRITDQAASDRAFYGAQFDGLKASILCRLSSVESTEGAAPCSDANGTVSPHLESHLASLRQAIADYTTDYTGAVDSLQTTMMGMLTSLDTSITNLEALVALIDPSADPADAPVPPGPGVPPAPTVPTVPLVPAVPSGPTVPSIPLVPATPTLPGGPVIDPAALDTLKADIASLKGVRDALSVGDLPALSFETHLENLDGWLDGTRTAVKDSVLEASVVDGLEVRDWTAYDPDSAGVYIDTSDALYLSIADLVTQTAETSGQLAADTLNVPDNLLVFEALLNSANATFTGAEAVHSGVTGLLSAGSTELGTSRQFYRNFSTVLANTRTQGVDTGKIHDFFSAPIAAKNITPERVAVAGTVDFTWMLVFAVGLLAGVLVTALSRSFRTKPR
jgi:YhgE/Pip-like protein